MTYSYLIDTDWVIHYLNGQAKIVDELTRLKPKGLALSIISLAELYEGVCYSRDPYGSKQSLTAFLSGIYLVEINEEICKIFGKQRGKLRKEGKLISDFDLLIGATCLHYNLAILTNNRRHFKVIEGLEIISV